MSGVLACREPDCRGRFAGAGSRVAGMGDQRNEEREREERGRAGERGAHPVGEQHLTVGPRSGGGEDGDEDAEAERAADVMRDVDQAAGDTRVAGVDLGHAGGGERAQPESLPDAEDDHWCE